MRTRFAAAVGAVTVALAVTVATPAVAAPLGFEDSASVAVTVQVLSEVDVQLLVVPAGPAQVVERDSYRVTAPPPPPWVPVTSTASAGAVRWPFPASTVTDGWGPRTCGGCAPFHEAVDFAPGWGAPVPAVAAGRVLEAGWSDVHGYNVLLVHAVDGVRVETFYAHMHSSPAVAVGQKVTVGQVLGFVGDTGVSYGAHSHFEAAVAGIKVDPYEWLTVHATP